MRRRDVRNRVPDNRSVRVGGMSWPERVFIGFLLIATAAVVAIIVLAAIEVAQLVLAS